ncbi:MAG: peptide chain release factor N(5)-glutamine methyltransferase [Bacilli bacterium]|nr:peptide chain release factor N(5)-glutamine methyltransferase [Bacilli bacterium]
MKLKELYLSLIKEGKKYHINELDIRFLITDVLSLKNQSSFYLKLNEEIKDIKSIKNAFEKLKSGVPLSYITNKAYFLGDIYYVNKDVLIPRVETEELVTLLIKRINEYYPNKKKLNILDVGIGSGVIAIKLKKEFPDARVDATEINEKAIKVAKKNIKDHHVKVNVYQADTFPENKVKYDIIVSNPPYIKFKKDVDKSVLDYEPHSALFISDQNNVYQKIFQNNHLSSPCLMLFEIAPNLVDDLKILMQKSFSQYSFNFSQDINHKIRFLSIVKK